MSGVKRYDCDPCHEHICRFEREESENGEYVLASDYERDTQALKAEVDRLSGECEGCPMAIAEELRIERDALRAQVDALRNAGLELRRFVSCNDVHHDRAEQHEYDEPCKVLARIDAALQAPKCDP